jgi:hypothetical protein
MSEKFERALRRLVEASRAKGRLLGRHKPKRRWDPMLDLVAPYLGFVIAASIFLAICGGR